MAFNSERKKGRGLERLFLSLNSIVLGLLFFNLFTVLQRDFEEVPKRLREGTLVNLNDDNPDQRIKALLRKGYYFEDQRDIDLISSVVAKGLNNSEAIIDNVGELNKSKYNVNAEQAYLSGGESYNKRVLLSRALLGFTGDDSSRYEQEKRNPEVLGAKNNIGIGNHSISGSIYNRNDDPVGGVLVRLQLLVPQDSVYSNDVSEVEKSIRENNSGIRKTFVLDSVNKRQLISLTAYARTDARGNYSFTNLPENKSYEILPLQPGFQFGSSKGVQELTKNATLSFYQSPHQIKLLSARDFNNLKKERSLMVRTPEQAKKMVLDYYRDILLRIYFIAFYAECPVSISRPISVACSNVVNRFVINYIIKSTGSFT